MDSRAAALLAQPAGSKAMSAGVAVVLRVTRSSGRPPGLLSGNIYIVAYCGLVRNPYLSAKK